MLSDYYYYNVAPPAAAWTFKFENQSPFGIAPSNLLFKDRLIIADGTNLYAVDVNTGKLIWKYSYPVSYYFEPYNYSDAKGLTLLSDSPNSFIIVDPDSGQEVIKQSYDRNKFNPQYPIDFKKLIQQYKKQDTPLEVETYYKKPGDLNISTPRVNYEYQMCMSFCFPDSADPGYLAKEANTGLTKWKYKLGFHENFNANDNLLFIIKNDGIYTFKH